MSNNNANIAASIQRKRDEDKKAELRRQ